MSRLTVVEGDIITWGTVGALDVNREKTRQYCYDHMLLAEA